MAVAAPVPGDLLTKRPDWARTAQSSEILAVYPAEAQRHRVSGRITMHCIVATDGQLKDCEVASEDPPGWGFGQAGLRLTPLFRMTPGEVHGVPVESELLLPLRFQSPN